MWLLDNPFSLVLGSMIVAVCFFDFVATILTVAGAGPLTTRINAGLWNCTLKLHRRRPSHRLLTAIGPLLTLIVMFIWFTGTWLGWTLVFASDWGALVNAQTGQPASLGERAYFVGYTLTTLGIGDYRATALGWQLLTIVVSANGLLLFTMAITYIVPLVSAAAAKRELAETIYCLGNTPTKLLTNAWDGERFQLLIPELRQLTYLIVQTGQQHANYPILHYFHTGHAIRALPVQLAALDEALTLLDKGVDQSVRPITQSYRPTQKAIQNWIDMRLPTHESTADAVPPTMSLGPIAEHGIPVISTVNFQHALANKVLHRQKLGALIHNDGWGWNAIHSSNNTG